MTQTPCPYDDRTRAHSYDSFFPEAENPCFVGTTRPYLPPHTTPHPDVAYAYGHNPHSDQPLFHCGEMNPPQFTIPPCLNLPFGSRTSDNISTDYRDMDSCEIYDPWGPSYPSSNLPLNTAYVGPSPAAHNSRSNSALHPGSSCRQISWPSWNDEVDFPDAFHGNSTTDYLPTSILPQELCPSSPYSNLTWQPHSGALDASYACLWTEDATTCNVTVQANRSYVNRHLHAYHGFVGSDTRQTRCRWVGCGETMQQGSIARHLVTCHLQAKVTCPTCSKKLSRQDVISKHQRICPAAASLWR